MNCIKFYTKTAFKIISELFLVKYPESIIFHMEIKCWGLKTSKYE